MTRLLAILILCAAAARGQSNAPLNALVANSVGIASQGTLTVLAVDADGLTFTGLLFLDTSNPRQAIQVSRLAGFGGKNGLVIVGRYVYAADGANGLKIIDVLNPASPVIVGSYNTAGYALNVTVTNNLAYVADGANGLVILDVANPASPVLVGSVDTPNNALAVDVAGGIAAVADSSSVQIIDVSNPTAPVVRGSVAVTYPSTALDVRIKGTIAYVAANAGGLSQFDISNPAAPRFISTIYPQVFSSSDATRSVRLSGNKAYCANSVGGLGVADIMTTNGLRWIENVRCATAYRGVVRDEARSLTLLAADSVALGVHGLGSQWPTGGASTNCPPCLPCVTNVCPPAAQPYNTNLTFSVSFTNAIGPMFGGFNTNVSKTVTVQPR